MKSKFTSPPGGVLTDTDQGAITGELTIYTYMDKKTAHVLVAYHGSEDFMPVAGSGFHFENGARALHKYCKSELSKDPGDLDGDGNLDPVQITF